MLEDKKAWVNLSLAGATLGMADEETPEYKVRRALEMYQVGTGSLGYVAEKVGLSKRDLIREARTRGIEPPFDEQAVREDQQAIEMPGTDVSEDEKA